MQSSMAYAVQEIERVTGRRIDLDDRTQVPLDDPAVFELLRTGRNLGVYQLESPGQLDLVGLPSRRRSRTWWPRSRSSGRARCSRT